MTTTTARPGFDVTMVDGLPEAARRWLTHAISTGAPLTRRAELHMHGEIRLGRRWHDFTASQVLVPAQGFVWAARTHLGPLPVRGFDAYADGTGSMRWRAAGIPVQRGSGGDVTLSALGRLAAEATLLPTSLLADAWYPAGTPDAAMYAHHIDGRYLRPLVVIRVGADGRLLGLTMHRWGAPLGRRYAVHRFTVRFTGELDTGSLLVPDGIVAAWPDAGGVFFRARLDRVDLG